MPQTTTTGLKTSTQSLRCEAEIPRVDSRKPPGHVLANLSPDTLVAFECRMVARVALAYFLCASQRPYGEHMCDTRCHEGRGTKERHLVVDQVTNLVAT